MNIMQENDFSKDLEEIIKNGRINSNWCRAGKYSDLMNHLNSLFPKISLYSEKLYLFINQKTGPNKCFCGEETKFHTFSLGYRRFCSNRCQSIFFSSFPEKMIKTKSTLMRKYGSENYNNSEKAKKTNLERYGHISAVHSDTIKEKVKKTNLERYGVENVLSLKAVIEKSRLTKIERYGFSDSNNLKEARESFRAKFANDLFFSDRLDDKVRPNFIESEYTNAKKKYSWICNSCETIFSSKLEKSIPRCPRCRVRVQRVSILEKEMKDFISTNYNIELNNRSILFPLELDVFIPEKRVAIEFNGTYWHSSRHKDKFYHQRKIELCSRKSVRLLHVYEWEWLNDRARIENKILNFIESQENVSARRPICKLIQNNK